MNNIYFPILKALDAEFTALKNLKKNSLNQIVPLFEIPKVPDRKKYRESLYPKKDFLEDVSNDIGEVWSGKFAMFDVFKWSPTETIENGEYIISYIYNTLNLAGINVIPVVGYDRWGVHDYQLALKSISQVHHGKFCIRLDHTAFEDSAEPEFLEENLFSILETLEIEPNNCHLILDFEDVTSISIIDFFAKFEKLFSLISKYSFMSYSIAGCSLPKSIDQAVKENFTCSPVPRKEILLWKTVRQQYSKMPIYFGDYGVRGPNTNEGIPTRNTNGKIRYSIENHHYIARGQLMRVPPKGEQMWQLAKMIMNSGHYLSAEFSWGDAEISRCANMEFKGSAAQWIAIDTNHHLTYVVAEITEFERMTTFAKTEHQANS